MEIIEKVSSVQIDIFNYKIQNVPNDIVSIFTEIIEGGIISPDNVSLMNQLNLLMNHCLMAMQQKDYLRLADLLEYELKPLVGGVE